jgi:predicted amidohydrolase YtcJ
MCRWCEPSPITDRLTAGLSVPARREFSANADAAQNGGPRVIPTVADVIFQGGTIRTMAGHDPVQALAIAGSTILAAGSVADISALAGNKTHTVNLQGRTLLPGLIDPHHHYTLAAVLGTALLDVGYSKFHTKAEMLAQLKATTAKTEAGQWIAASFYDNLLQGGDLSMGDLDAVSTVHPIFIMYVNGHVGAANALAFQKAGIGDDVGVIPGGGHFGRGPDGTLTGTIYEQPALMRFIGAAVPTPSPELIAAAITDYAKAAAAAGYTTLHEPGTIKPDAIDGLAKLSNVLDVRLSASFSTDAAQASKAFAILGPAAKARRIAGSRLSLYGMKMWADGSNQAEMAAQSKPYLNSTQQGKANYTPGEFAGLCQAAKDAGWPIVIHCQGDAAVEQALDAIEDVYGAYPATGINRIDHATMARRDQVDRMKTLGIEPTFIPDFIYLYGAAYRDQIFGPERAEAMAPFGAADQAGVEFSLHSDAPAAGLPVNPLRYLQTAVTRRCAIDGSVIGPELRLTIDAAIKAVTATAARHIGLADTLGTLEAGKEADLTILESDPYTCDQETIMSIPVSQTWVAGEKKFG